MLERRPSLFLQKKVVLLNFWVCFHCMCYRVITSKLYTTFTNLMTVACVKMVLILMCRISLKRSIEHFLSWKWKIHCTLLNVCVCVVATRKSNVFTFTEKEKSCVLKSIDYTTQAFSLWKLSLFFFFFLINNIFIS